MIDYSCTYVDSRREGWANILHVALIGVHGFSATAGTNPAGTAGNVVFLHLFIAALALQPCNPTRESCDKARSLCTYDSSAHPQFLLLVMHGSEPMSTDSVELTRVPSGEHLLAMAWVSVLLTTETR
ncbi:hypothetical protein PTI98_009088 [Pleurotus ostreatus]|nr:hypothetical protein PTI98_009088 [Pleurotus ostreatus]